MQGRENQHSGFDTYRPNDALSPRLVATVFPFILYPRNFSIYDGDRNPGVLSLLRLPDPFGQTDFSFSVMRKVDGHELTLLTDTQFHM